MSLEVDVQEMALDALAQRCKRETDHYLKQKVNDTRYCFELFRRAIQDGSAAAWDFICTQYQALMMGWVKKHHAFESTREDPEYFVNGAFGKVSRTITAEKFGSFSDLSYLLRYLKMCVHSVIMDYTRTMDFEALSDWDEASKEESKDPTPEQQAIDRSEGQMLWQFLRDLLPADKERLVIYASFVLALKPQEIFEHYPHVFESVDEIYRIKQNVITRLRRNPELRKLFGLDD